MSILMLKRAVGSKQKIQFRNIFGYLLFFGLLFFLVLFHFTEIPIGLTPSEMISVTNAGNLGIDGWFLNQIINLPYHVTQWLSINIFDISVFSIKLPSIVMAILTGVMILFIVRELYDTKVAILTSLIIISCILFLSIGRTGAPMIMPIFLSTIAMFAVSRALHKSDHNLRWLVLAGATMALNLYSPMGIYITIITAIAAAFHPKVRLILFKLKPWKMIIAMLILLILITPLVIGIIRDPSISLEILGVNDFNFAIDSVKSNLLAIVWPMGGKFVGIATPLLTMSILAFMVLGIIGAVNNFHSVRSYLAIPLFGVILLLILFNINAAPLLLVPMILLVAIGINFLIIWWFNLFPRNPYAKAAGFIPLTILFGWMILSSSARYFETSFYDKNLVYSYHSGFNIIQEITSDNTEGTIIITKDSVEQSFYKIALRKKSNIVVSDTIPDGSKKIVLLQSAFDIINNRKPDQIVANSHKNNSEIIRIFDNK